MMNYDALRREPFDTALTASGKPKRGFAKITFACDGEVRTYDLRGPVCTSRQFSNWAKREFGYLKYDLEFA